MLQRITIYVLCICLVGITAVPASLLPCCCKRVGTPMPVKKPPCCCQPAGQAMGASGLRQQMSLVDAGASTNCCASAQHTTCRTGRTVKKNCPVCRCLDQMQVIALAGSVTAESHVKMPTIALPAVDSILVDCVKPSVGYLSEHYSPPGLMITLRTCSLRC